MTHRWFCLRVIPLVLGVAVGAGAAAEESDGPKGGHPLNQRPRRPTLEDLLDAPDWQTGPAAPTRPKPSGAAEPAAPGAAAPFAPVTPVGPDAPGGPTIGDLIATRHRIIDRGRVFDRLAVITKDKKALNDEDVENLRDWSACYQEMRALLRPDRGDANLPRILDALERDIKQRKDFYEGRVLAALGHVYRGNAAKATEHLQLACEGFWKHRLFWTIFAQDSCHVLLLLNRPDDVKDFIEELRKLSKQTAIRCWLVATYEALLNHEGEARRFFDRALVIAGIPDAERLPAGTDPLVGDAALFLLTASLESKRDVDRARAILGKTPPESRDWRILRARSALEANDGNWDAAMRLLDDATRIAPPTLADDIRAQRDAYAARRSWVRPRPKKK